MKVYLDACALNRLSDDQSQSRIRAEAEAVKAILGYVLLGKVEWIAGRVLEVELRQNPHLEKRRSSLELLAQAHPQNAPNSLTILRGEELHTLGYGVFDALHLAFAEANQVDVLLTTDDRFIGKATRGVGDSRVRVANPVDWIAEVRAWLQSNK